LLIVFSKEDIQDVIRNTGSTFNVSSHPDEEFILVINLEWMVFEKIHPKKPSILRACNFSCG